MRTKIAASLALVLSTLGAPAIAATAAEFNACFNLQAVGLDSYLNEQLDTAEENGVDAALIAEGRSDAANLIVELKKGAALMAQMVEDNPLAAMNLIRNTYSGDGIQDRIANAYTSCML